MSSISTCQKFSHGVRVAATLCCSVPRIYRTTTGPLSLCRDDKKRLTAVAASFTGGRVAAGGSFSIEARTW